jgi:hypothetical protein
VRLARIFNLKERSNYRDMTIDRFVEMQCSDMRYSTGASSTYDHRSVKTGHPVRNTCDSTDKCSKHVPKAIVQEHFGTLCPYSALPRRLIFSYGSTATLPCAVSLQCGAAAEPESHCAASREQCIWEVVVERRPFQRRLRRGKYKSSDAIMFVCESYYHLSARNGPQFRKAMIV